MTVEELKKIAGEMGYNIVKQNRPLPKLLDCSCGRNCRSISLATNGHAGKYGRFLKCVCCGLEGAPGKTKREIYENWNRAVLESQAK